MTDQPRMKRLAVFFAMAFVCVGKLSAASAKTENQANCPAHFAKFFRSDEFVRRYLSDRADGINSAIADGLLTTERIESLRRLGWIVDPGSAEPLVPPRWVDIDRMWQAAVDSRNIPQGSRLRPVQVHGASEELRIEEGTVRVGQFVPAGSYEYSELETVQLLNTIARGEFPIGNEELVVAGTNIYVHDSIGHIAPYEQRPALAKVLVESAQNLMRAPNFPPGDPEQSIDLNHKVRLAIEYVAGSRLTEIEMRQALGFNENLKSAESLNVDRIINEQLKSLSRKNLKLLAKDLDQKIPKLIEFFGGVYNDALIFNRSRALRPEQFVKLSDRSSFLHLWSELQQAQNSINPWRLQKAVARVQAFLYHLSRTTPEQIASDALQPITTRNSDLYRLYCGSGAMAQLWPDMRCKDVP